MFIAKVQLRMRLLKTLLKLELFIESCYSRGCLDEVLRDCGFALESSPESQQSPGQLRMSTLFAFPYPLLRMPKTKSTGKLTPVDWRTLVRIFEATAFP